MSGTHSKYAPSSGHRWLVCSESLNTDAVSEDNAASLEGTGAHEIAARCLFREVDAWELIDLETENGTICTAEMSEYVQVYLDYVRSLEGYRAIEVKLDGSSIHPDLGGTADAVVFRADYLEVVDLKYGIGVFVEVEDNEQLKIYALLAAMQSECEDNITVKITIVQPRREDPIRSQTFTARDLYIWRDEVLIPGIQSKNTFNAGEHCKYCVRGMALQCPLTLAMFDAFVKQGVMGDTNEEIDRRYEQLVVVEEVSKWIKAEMYKRLTDGVKMGSAKLVAGKSNRVWKSSTELADGSILTLEEAVHKSPIGNQAYTEPELKSPAVIEKLGSQGAKFVQEWAYKPPIAPRVAPLTDKSPAVTVRTASDVFANVKET